MAQVGALCNSALQLMMLTPYMTSADNGSSHVASFCQGLTAAARDMKREPDILLPLVEGTTGSKN